MIGRSRDFYILYVYEHTQKFTNNAFPCHIEFLGLTSVKQQTLGNSTHKNHMASAENSGHK